MKELHGSEVRCSHPGLGSSLTFLAVALRFVALALEVLVFDELDFDELALLADLELADFVPFFVLDFTKAFLTCSGFIMTPCLGLHLK